MSRFARGELPRPSGFLGDHSKFIHSSLILVWLIGFDIFDFGFIFQIKSPKKWWPQRWTAAMPATSCRRFGVISQLEERRVDRVGPGQDGKHEYSHFHIMYIFKYEYMINIMRAYYRCMSTTCLQHVYNMSTTYCWWSVCIVFVDWKYSNFYQISIVTGGISLLEMYRRVGDPFWALRRGYMKSIKSGKPNHRARMVLTQHLAIVGDNEKESSAIVLSFFTVLI